MSEHDGIIVGSGHNSLVLQAYLCKAGLDVICLERRDTAGGGLATMEDPRYPGFLHNTHSFYHRAITDMPWYRDLDLERHGAGYIEPELNVALLLRDGSALEWWTDFDRTAASFAQFSSKDAESLRKWRDDFRPIVRDILGPEAQAPPLPPDERDAMLKSTQEGRLLLDVSRLSPLEFVKQEFENPVIQAGLLFFNGLREVDLRVSGFGHHIAALLASERKAQMCLGGSASLARALVSAVEEAGGTVRLRTEPKRFIVEGGRAAGVESADGEIFRARKFVASGLNPHQTLLELLDAGDISDEWRQKADGFEYNLIAPLFGLNLNLREPPRYKHVETSPHLDKAFMVIMELEHIDQYVEMVMCHERGEIPPSIMWGSCPTQFDPSQAPAGMHTAFMWSKVPYALRGDAANWDREREAHGERLLGAWTTHAPNLGNAVIDSFVRSPHDVERTFPNMRQGDLLIGAFTNGQIGYNRPFPGAGHYRTAVDGLYLCGSCCHPGGNITGLPGYNCAQVIKEDLAVA